MIRLFKILLTNSVHLPVFYVVIGLSGLFLKTLGLTEPNVSWNFVLANTFSSTYELLFLYGRWLILGFYSTLIVLDIICFGLLKMRVIELLLSEWFLLSIPFIYWAYERQYWLWIILCLAFSGTQLIRRSMINKVLNFGA